MIEPSAQELAIYDDISKLVKSFENIDCDQRPEYRSQDVFHYAAQVSTFEQSTRLHRLKWKINLNLEADIILPRSSRSRDLHCR